MIDPMVSLAFAIYSNKGAYALLLGSGTSRAAGIPTGWEVVLDLIRKVAKLEGEECGADPAVWFKAKHGLEADYGKLLDVVAKTPTERQQLLRGYFEPTADERAQGLKLPSAAHRAIAWLVSEGYIRVIVTTNFDRLLEKALEEAGVAPTVVSTVDQLKGVLPLTHSGATIIKIHGDYLDSRIKNTKEELNSYDPALCGLLDRVFDEYGLIVCGWSADWDTALRAAMERCSSRRFSIFWSARGELSPTAKALATLRAAETLQIRDADQLFDQLKEKVQTLSDLAAPHPLSGKMAAATVKRYLVDDASRIRLRDLVHEETERLAHELREEVFPAAATQDHRTELIGRMGRYESLCGNLVSVLVAGCHWGNHEHAKAWCRCIQRIVNLPNNHNGLDYLIKLRRYPALLLLYASALGAVSAGNYRTLAMIFGGVRVKDNGKDEPLVSRLNTSQVMETSTGHWLPGMDRRYTPLSDYLYGKLREPLREYLPSDEEYQFIFDRVEYLLGLLYADQSRKEYQGGWVGPYGCFVWRGRAYGERCLPELVEEEIAAEGPDWGPVKAGLFSGSHEQASIAAAKFKQYLGRLPLY
jgi:hypothetical protein